MTVFSVRFVSQVFAFYLESHYTSEAKARFQSTALPTELPAEIDVDFAAASWGFHHAAMWL